MFAPRLDEAGNSVKAQKVIAYVADKLDYESVLAQVSGVEVALSPGASVVQETTPCGVTLLLLSAQTMGRVLYAQPPQGQPSATDVLKAIDELVEKNRQLERQNQELMNQIQTLRQLLQTQAGAQHTPAQAPSADSNTPDPAVTQAQSNRHRQLPGIPSLRAEPVPRSCKHLMEILRSSGNSIQAVDLPSGGASTEN